MEHEGSSRPSEKPSTDPQPAQSSTHDNNLFFFKTHPVRLSLKMVHLPE
jgi:hypothetical protein